MATGQKGTKANPYTMAEYESMANAGTWEGGFVMDDSGEAVYMMREVTVKGSGSDSGSETGSSPVSQFEFSDGSYTPHNPEDDDDDDDDDDENGGIGGGPDGGNDMGDEGWHHGGGGHQGGNTGDAGTTPVGTFNQYAEYYTETQMEAMHTAGTWRGGNVYTLGYVGPDFVIHPKIQALEKIDESWIGETGNNLANRILEQIRLGIHAIRSAPYTQAVEHYNAGTGQPLSLPVDSLGFDNLTRNMLEQAFDEKGKIIEDTYTLRLLSDVFDLNTPINKLSENHTYEEKIRIFSVALTLGTISLRWVSPGTYMILSDTYDFDIKKWSGNVERNIGTLLGLIVSESLSIQSDIEGIPLWAPMALRTIYIANGMMRRHILGTSKFKIKFNGTITLKP